MALTVGSLFSGIGGIDLGLERAGMESRWFVEWDAHCQNVLRRHWPGVPVYGDITTIDWSRVEPVDVLAGGFPCQPVSNAGKRLGTDDDRWLWPEFARAIRALEPRYVLVENVAALLGRGFEHVITDLAALGYDAEWDCIPAAAVGAPHLRDRLWIVAHSRPAEVRTGQSSVRTDRANAGWSETPRSSRGSRGVVAIAPSFGWREGWPEPTREQGRFGVTVGSRTDVAHSAGSPHVPQIFGHQADGSNPLRSAGWTGRSGWWATEPDVGGTLDGFSAWLDGYERMTQAHVLVLAYANATQARPGEVLRSLWDQAGASDVRGSARGPGGISATEVLLAYLRELENRCSSGDVPLESAEDAAARLRGMWEANIAACPSCGRNPRAQRARQHPDPLHALPRLLAQDAGAAWAAYRRSDASPLLAHPWAPGWESGIARVSDSVPHRVDRLRALGNAVVPQVVEWIGRRIVAFDEGREVKAA